MRRCKNLKQVRRPAKTKHGNLRGKGLCIMSNLEVKKYCGRCNCNIICNESDIENCQCNTVNISQSTKDFLLETQYDCLCAGCLSELNELVTTNKREPLKPINFIEGKHFYKEGEFFVFTELYHYLKGSCCGNACRHCAYGLRKNKTIKQL